MRSFRSRLCRMIVTFVFAPKFKPGISVERQRKALDKFARRAMLPAGTRIQQVNADGVRGEWVSVDETGGKSAILYLHGGAYNMGSAQTHRELTARISKAGGVKSLLIWLRMICVYAGRIFRSVGLSIDDLSEHQWYFDFRTWRLMAK